MNVQFLGKLPLYSANKNLQPIWYTLICCNAFPSHLCVYVYGQCGYDPGNKKHSPENKYFCLFSWDFFSLFKLSFSAIHLTWTSLPFQAYLLAILTVCSLRDPLAFLFFSLMFSHTCLYISTSASFLMPCFHLLLLCLSKSCLFFGSYLKSYMIRFLLWPAMFYLSSKITAIKGL